ncbi:ATP-dependent helicase [Desulfosarcina ovata]|uniref:DNA 3'-5' helicase n=1 Tax=Desulfosarcina ovata subsp. ovata TaxID=2752305 RepID=A0A5K8AL54_9BACT|nr:ATP-dependent helicase [Desulfosarcina ovata]BBO93348.1 DNA helicase [Desulfosarcina ovata subsp. ovata]
MQLSPQQQAAVQHTGSPALVVAGAGSGKTRTLTAKFAHLVAEGMPPERIMAITFTNKAADEMKGRLLRMTGLSLARFPWVRTYHSACLQILKKHCQLLGYHTPLQIFTAYHQQKTVKEILLGLNFDKKHAMGVLGQISNAKNSGHPGAYFDQHPRQGNIRLIDIYDRYEATLKAANAVDFDNILLLTRNLLRDHADIRQRYQDWFQYILCDEYQDTNDLNEEITALLLKDGNLFAVGDDWQSIYSFRMSNVGHFLSFQKKYKGSRIFRLEQNYRSADEIVQLGNHVIGHNENRMDKACFSDKQGGVVETHEFVTDQEEAFWVVDKVRSLVRMKVPLDKMAVLYRTKFCSLPFEQAFRRADIPYHMMGGKGFFERMEILDLNCYITAAVFDKDDTAFERIVNTPKRGIGPGTLKKIAGMRGDGMSLQDAARKAVAERVLSPKLYKALSELLDLLDEIRDLKPDEAIKRALTRSGYMDYLENYTRSHAMDLTTRQENIEQLIHAAAQKETIAEYLEEAALVREDKEEDEEEQTGGINLSTVHAAKGLEFHTVFVVGCEEQLFPHWRSMDRAEDLEEERRLMYVAVTRAERCLFITSANFRKGQFNPRSRFLEEIDAVLGDR